MEILSSRPKTRPTLPKVPMNLELPDASNPAPPIKPASLRPLFYLLELKMRFLLIFLLGLFSQFSSSFSSPPTTPLSRNSSNKPWVVVATRENFGQFESVRLTPDSVSFCSFEMSPHGTPLKLLSRSEISPPSDDLADLIAQLETALTSLPVTSAPPLASSPVLSVDGPSWRMVLIETEGTSMTATNINGFPEIGSMLNLVFNSVKDSGDKMPLVRGVVLSAPILSDRPSLNLTVEYGQEFLSVIGSFVPLDQIEGVTPSSPSPSTNPTFVEYQGLGVPVYHVSP